MDSLHGNNIDDILQEKEWHVRNEANWIDEKEEEFLREYNDLPPPPRRRLQLRETEQVLQPPLRKPSLSSPPMQRGQNNNERKKRGKWTYKELRDAINALDYDYKMHEVCETFTIPRGTNRNHYNGRIKKGRWNQKLYLLRRKMKS